MLWIMVCVTCLKISYASHNYEIMSVCMCVKQQTDDLYAYSSVIYIVVIDKNLVRKNNQIQKVQN